jgi:hypothetical protein
MKTYFSLASDQDGAFQVLDKHFYNFVEFGTNPGGLDEVAIVDGCGRYIPICMNDVPDLIAALQDAYHIAMELDMYNKLVDYTMSPYTQQFVEDSFVQPDPKPVQAVA